MAERFFRIDSSEAEARALLDERRQVSEPWDGGSTGRCDKCNGTGRTRHRCESCRAGADPGCPSCEGRVFYERDCPACQGTGKIDDAARKGVSVFPDEAGLYRYMVRREANLEGSVLVELEGELSDEEDFDADEGALLVHPTRIVDVREPDWRAVQRCAAA